MYFCSGKPMQFCSGVDTLGEAVRAHVVLHSTKLTPGLALTSNFPAKSSDRERPARLNIVWS